jgi:hypothetical protein
MANLLQRLLRPRAGEEGESAEAPQPEPPEGPEPEAGETASAAAKPKPATKGPRKTRDEVSSIGPGEP